MTFEDFQANLEGLARNHQKSQAHQRRSGSKSQPGCFGSNKKSKQIAQVNAFKAKKAKARIEQINKTEGERLIADLTKAAHMFEAHQVLDDKVLPFYEFPKIRQFHQVCKDLRAKAYYAGQDADDKPIYDTTRPLGPVEFEGRVKLHGTNAAIVFTPPAPGDEVSYYCQSRERLISQESDNAGFAHWVAREGHRLWDWIAANTNWVCASRVVVYGEWCGGSIQAGVALNELPKMFVIFGVKVIVDQTSRWTAIWQIPPMREIGIYTIDQIPGYKVSVDLNRPDKAIAEMNALVDAIDIECPFCKALFDISGHGEGIVWKPAGDPSFKMAFKTKGESHSASKIRKLPTVDVAKMDCIEQAVATYVHEDRLRQGFAAVVQGPEDETFAKIGDFVRWVVNDSWIEEEDSLLASDISRKEWGSAASKVCSTWFKNKLNSL